MCKIARRSVLTFASSNPLQTKPKSKYSSNTYKPSQNRKPARNLVFGHCFGGKRTGEAPKARPQNSIEVLLELHFSKDLMRRRSKSQLLEAHRSVPPPVPAPTSLSSPSSRRVVPTRSSRARRSAVTLKQAFNRALHPRWRVHLHLLPLTVQIMQE